MNREIKFRGKLLDTGEWIYGDLMSNVEGAAAVVPPFDTGLHNICNDYEVDKDTVGQLTGLHDKNGRDIYEGDLLEWEEVYRKKQGAVVWRDYGFYVTYNTGLSGTETISPINLFGDAEVIGNIHDNPDWRK